MTVQRQKSERQTFVKYSKKNETKIKTPVNNKHEPDQKKMKKRNISKGANNITKVHKGRSSYEHQIEDATLLISDESPDCDFGFDHEVQRSEFLSPHSLAEDDPEKEL